SPIYYELTDVALKNGDEIVKRLWEYRKAGLSAADRSEITAWLKAMGIEGPGGATTAGLSAELMKTRKALKRLQQQIHDRKAVIVRKQQSLSELVERIQNSLKTDIEEFKGALNVLAGMRLPEKPLIVRNLKERLRVAESALQNEEI